LGAYSSPPYYLAGLKGEKNGGEWKRGRKRRGKREREEWERGKGRTLNV